MTPASPASRPRWTLARDVAGRDLFVPWHPLARSAWLLPDPARRDAIARRVRWACGIAFAAIFVLAVAGAPAPWLYAVVPVAALDYALWIRRATRGLVRTRYEPPAA